MLAQQRQQFDIVYGCQSRGEVLRFSGRRGLGIWRVRIRVGHYIGKFAADLRPFHFDTHDLVGADLSREKRVIHVYRSLVSADEISYQKPDKPGNKDDRQHGHNPVGQSELRLLWLVRWWRWLFTWGNRGWHHK